VRIQVHDSIDETPAADWNRLAGTQPFVQHAFLATLEHSGCVSADAGWQPQHLTCTDDDGRLIGALPLYLKSHSWGEYVFDWAWAEAYQRTGRHYYPKLVAAVPFTPVAGPRLLLSATAKNQSATQALVRQTIELAKQHRASSVHCLFPADDEQEIWKSLEFLPRMDCQFHWHNRGYQDFDNYLAMLSAEKRKKIKRERRRIAESGIRHRIYTGAELDDALLDALSRFYAATYAKRGHRAYLNRSFFAEIATRMPENLVVIFAFHSTQPVACAICFRDAHTLYGRHWGCEHEYHSLHFETCYYQGIEYCIREGLQLFNPGTQGEHKLARGFEPAVTQSMHWIAEPYFRKFIADFLQQETRLVDEYIQEAGKHLPFRHMELA
jgi:predicted N-acyltransferase